MSAHISVKDLPKGGEMFDPARAGALKSACGLIGFVCLAATLFFMFTKQGLSGFDLEFASEAGGGEGHANSVVFKKHGADYDYAVYDATEAEIAHGSTHDLHGEAADQLKTLLSENWGSESAPKGEILGKLAKAGNFRLGAGDKASYSYLFAVTFFLTLGIGGLFWTILHHATNSGWGIAVRRQMENLAGLVPFIFVLILPFWMPDIRGDLWEWETKAHKLLAHAEEQIDEVLAKKDKAWKAKEDALNDQIDFRGEAIRQLQSGENGPKGQPGEIAALESQMEDLDQQLQAHGEEKPTKDKVQKYIMGHEDPLLAHKWFFYFDFAYLRLTLYTFGFIVIVWLLRKWSIDNDKIGGVKLFRKCRYWGSFFILPFAVGYTFLVIDFLMAMDYKWFSTMWGVYLFAGAALNSMALLIIVVTYLRSKGYLQKVVTPEHYHLMGKLMFAFCVFWAYIAFSQYFLIWYANITEETTFFLLRNSGGWNTVSICLVVGHFFIPFVILLFQPLKKKPHLLATVAVWNLIMHIVDIYWIVIPERGPSLSSMAAGGKPQLWFSDAVMMDVVAFVGVGCTLTFVFLNFILNRSSLYAYGDPRLEESINVAN